MLLKMNRPYVTLGFLLLRSFVIRPFVIRAFVFRTFVTLGLLYHYAFCNIRPFSPIPYNMYNYTLCKFLSCELSFIGSTLLRKGIIHPPPPPHIRFEYKFIYLTYFKTLKRKYLFL